MFKKILQRVKKDEIYVCPHCGMMLPVTSLDYFVQWQENLKTFKIRATCPAGCNTINDWSEILISVAEKSRCSCGSELQLSDYSISGKGNDVVLKIKYTCKKCNYKKSYLSKVSSFISKV